jgi:serine/threonine protein kinase
MLDPLIDQQLDDYLLEKLLGQGGMASVYRGRDTRVRRYVAVKVIGQAFRNSANYAARFEREAQAIAQLEHPNIVRLYRYGEAKGILYMAMQYVEGSDLATELEHYQRTGEIVPLEDTRRLVRQVCLALDYAHSKGVIHRDIKPANILLNKEGDAILTDFGLALLTQEGTIGEIFGSPHYIAPEQAISSAGAVPQSDFYSVGVILYEMFTGIVPFDADSALSIAMLHVTEPPRPPREIRPDLSPALEAVILKCLAKAPQDRYPNGAALAAAVEQALQGDAVAKQRPLPNEYYGTGRAGS